MQVKHPPTPRSARKSCLSSALSDVLRVQDTPWSLPETKGGAHHSQRKDYDGCPATTRPLSSTPSSQVSLMCIQLKDKKAWLAPPGVLLGKRKARDQPEHEVTAWLSLLQRQAYSTCPRRPLASTPSRTSSQHFLPGPPFQPGEGPERLLGTRPHWLWWPWKQEGPS